MAVRILVAGNCFCYPVATAVRELLPDASVSALSFMDANKPTDELATLFGNPEIILHQLDAPKPIGELIESSPATKAALPRIVFNALFPDCVYAKQKSRPGFIRNDLGPYNSAIMLHAYRRSWTTEQTVATFRADVFDSLGYFDMAAESYSALAEECDLVGFPIEDHFPRWIKKRFMYTLNHPRLFVAFDVVNHILAQLGLKTGSLRPAAYSYDNLWFGNQWAIYPGIGELFGLDGKYAFVKAGDRKAWAAAKTLDLRQMIAQSLSAYAGFERDDIDCERIETDAFLGLEPVGANLARRKMRTPYDDLPQSHFWRRSVADVDPCDVRPIAGTAFKIDKETKISTAGSCFAQHIARALKQRGYNYAVYERGPERFSRDELLERNYGVFSARYGNVYTAKQLRQLIDRALHRFKPYDNVWARADGRFVDPFRPQIHPRGFRTIGALEKSRKKQLAATRSMILDTDVFIFTLGLTETWVSLIDGAAFPLAPGVAGGEYDPARYTFENASLAEIVADLEYVLAVLLKLNSTLRVILTVSPVPLAATYAGPHVLSATTYSKSVLRVAAEEITRRYPQVYYFPSYEIITGSFNRGAYYGSDLRSVTEQGVAHVMDVFFEHFAAENKEAAIRSSIPKHCAVSDATRDFFRVVCEEEELDRIFG